MKTVYKYHVTLSHKGTLVKLTGPILPHTELTEGGLDFWAEVGVFETPVEHELKVFVTGQDIPDNARWIATNKLGAFVGHLYEMMPPS